MIKNLLALGVFLFAMNAFATDYYVSATGSGSTCSSGSRCSPTTAMANAVSPAVIRFADGTYPNLTINRGGSSTSSRFVYQCDNGISSAFAAQGHCKFTGSGFAFTLGNGNNFDIRGFDIGGNPSQMVAIDGIPCGSSGQSTCLNSVHIIGNYIHDLAQNVSVDSSGCNIPGSAPGAILILNAHFRYITDLQIIGNIVFRFGPLNYPLACQQSNYAFYIDTPDAIVYNNLLFGRGAYAIHNYGIPCRARISNNTIIGFQFAMAVTGGGENICSPGVLSINNNLMIGQTKGTMSFSNGSMPCTDSSHQLLWSHNISEGVHPDFNGSDPNNCSTTTPGSDTAFTHASGTSLFVNYQPNGTGDYHLKAGAAAINGGSSTCVSGGATPCVPSTDIDGNGYSNQVGAFAFNSGTNVPPGAPTSLTATVH